MHDFLSIAAPVLFANLATVAFVYACWLAAKNEYANKKLYVRGLVGIVFILLFVLAGILADPR